MSPSKLDIFNFVIYGGGCV